MQVKGTYKISNSHGKIEAGTFSTDKERLKIFETVKRWSKQTQKQYFVDIIHENKLQL